MNIEKVIMELSDDEIKELFAELTEWKDTGDLKKNGLVRKIYTDYCYNIGYEPYMDFSIIVMKEQLLYYIAKRYIESL
jgi:hypothetical protein